MQGTVAHYSNVALRFAHEGINVTFLAAWDIPKCELSQQRPYDTNRRSYQVTFSEPK